MTNNGIDGDISDGISVISDCDSISDRHSPMPIKNESRRLCIDDEDEASRSNTSQVEEIENYTLVERSTENEVEVHSTSRETQRKYVWNPSNIILFGLIVGAAAILSSQCWKINLWNETLMPEVSLLAQRIQDLEIENLALKVEVNRLVELHHAGHDHFHSTGRVDEQRPVKQKKVWTGADETPIHIPYPVKEQYCNDDYLNSDDLFSSYNLKKCEDDEDTKKEKDAKIRQKDDFDDEKLKKSEYGSQQFQTRKKKNITTDDNASYKREKYAESKYKNGEKEEATTDTDQNIPNEKLVKIQEERKKLFDEATQKYLERQKKMEKKQDKDKKHRDDILKDQKNSDKQSKDTDPEWYDKMMKQREELRAAGGNSAGIKQRNKENWYIERANEREKVRGKHEKQSKTKQYQ